jgi:hypothetical protein
MKLHCIALLLLFVPMCINCSQAEESASSHPSKIETLAYGILIPDKPGFVKSPYKPDAGMIDVRGFKADAEVMDPYSQKIFLVPAPAASSPSPPPTATPK